MSSTFLSIFTMFNYDPTIFDDMVIPEQMDEELLIDNILLELSEFEVLYNDPDFLKFAIGRWSNKELSNWEKLYKTTVLTYNPIENYNRTENTTDLETRDLNGSNNQTRALNATNNETRDLDGSNVETRNLASTGTENNTTASADVGSGSDTNVKSVTGFNGPDLVTKEQDVTTLGTTKETDTTSESTFGGTDTGTKSVATEDNGTVNTTMTDTGTVVVLTTDGGLIDTTRTSNAFGNIGVTTTQQMIEQERKVLEFKIYDHIINSFKLRFCITVY